MNLECQYCGESPEGKNCQGCEKNIAKWSMFCPLCGKECPTELKSDNINPYDIKNRTLCSDGSCIGIIGVNGLCTECHKPK